jgi:heme exporter protein CcmD
MSDHTGFIIASYAVAGVVVLGLIVSIWRDYIHLRAQMRELEGLMSEGSLHKGVRGDE